MDNESFAEKLMDIWLAGMLFVITLVITLVPFGFSFLFVYLFHSWWGMLFNLSYLFLGPLFLFLWSCYIDYIKSGAIWY